MAFIVVEVVIMLLGGKLVETRKGKKRKCERVRLPLMYPYPNLTHPVREVVRTREWTKPVVSLHLFLRLFAEQNYTRHIIMCRIG